ncbi:MAG: hypothetical protein PHX08_10390 [Lachnospiraceae bacterium]|nr:hypothetical protein [Lachnospiraceae bacterium]
MLFLIQCVVICVIFTIVIMVPLYKNPMSMIASYPPKIRARVESLPQYKDTAKAKEKSHIIRKIIGCLIAVLILVVIDWYSGARDFTSAFIYSFGIFFVVNLYDLFVLDIGIACHDKRVRIPGTEDMDQEYRQIGHHIKGAVKGTIIGAAASLLAALVVLGLNVAVRR